MNRDPINLECTRDPVFLLQVGTRQWTQIPDGIEYDGESMWVEDAFVLNDWIKPFIDDNGNVDTTDGFWAAAESESNDHGWPLVYVEWRTESVFLTRDEAETWAKAREYRWQKWRVYCIPCDGELAKILREHEPRSEGFGASVWQACDTCRNMTQHLFISSGLVQCQECLEITGRRLSKKVIEHVE